MTRGKSNGETWDQAMSVCINYLVWRCESTEPLLPPTTPPGITFSCPPIILRTSLLVSFRPLVLSHE